MAIVDLPLYYLAWHCGPLDPGSHVGRQHAAYSTYMLLASATGAKTYPPLTPPAGPGSTTGDAATHIQ